MQNVLKITKITFLFDLGFLQPVRLHLRFGPLRFFGPRAKILLLPVPPAKKWRWGVLEVESTGPSTSKNFGGGGY